MSATNTKILHENEKPGWFSTILLVLVLWGMGIYLLMEMGLAFKQLINIEQRPLYLVGSHNLLPLLCLIPALFLAALGLILKDLKKLTAEKFDWGIKAVLVCGAAFIIVRILYGGFFIDRYMNKHGFSYCNPLTAVSALSPQIWVSDPAYCLEDSRNVSSEVKDWLDAKMAVDERPTAEEAEQQIKQLAQAYQARFNRF